LSTATHDWPEIFGVAETTSVRAIRRSYWNLSHGAGFAEASGLSCTRRRIGRV